ncbi:hypothetical protein [Microbacterium paludicola]|uniref:hypothetical protein n=1 Tax=Microbacterium paludicola TaxID=300019 RepID=UPI0031D999AD
MTTRQQRVLRGAVAAAVATLLAATSHTIAGAPAPAPLLIGLMMALLTPVAGSLAGPRPSLVRLAAAVIVSQVAFHGAFQLLGSPTGVGMSPATAHAHAHGAVDPTMLQVTAAAPEGVGMYVAHAIAAVLTIALLWRGERVVHAIARETLRVLRRAEAPRPALIPDPPAAFASPVRPSAPRLLLSVSWRGPPASLRA